MFRLRAYELCRTCGLFHRKLTWPQPLNSDPENVYCNAAETG
jgi:hypothetical protein